MPLTIQPRTWVLAERLYVHCYSPQDFVDLLARHGITYNNSAYARFDQVPVRYPFMSQDDSTFARFMTGVPTHVYLRLLERIVFDDCVIRTAQDNWNYYGEYIKHWRPQLLDLLRVAGVTIDEPGVSLDRGADDGPAATDEFLPHAFADSFLDFMRSETNAAYDAHLFLAVMFLSRKIVEACVVRVMEAAFPKIVSGQYSEANHQMWFDKNRGRLLGLGSLLENMNDRAGDFHEDMALVKESIALFRPLKREADECVHADFSTPDAAYVDGWHIPATVHRFRRLFRKYCNP
jgi:hypothetical protein